LAATGFSFAVVFPVRLFSPKFFNRKPVWCDVLNLWKRPARDRPGCRIASHLFTSLLSHAIPSLIAEAFSCSGRGVDFLRPAPTCVFRLFFFLLFPQCSRSPRLRSTFYSVLHRPPCTQYQRPLIEVPGFNSAITALCPLPCYSPTWTHIRLLQPEQDAFFLIGDRVGSESWSRCFCLLVVLHHPPSLCSPANVSFAVISGCSHLLPWTISFWTISLFFLSLLRGPVCGEGVGSVEAFFNRL